MEKKTASSLFVNDGSFMERFKQLQQKEKEKGAAPLNSSSIPLVNKPNLAFNASSTQKTNPGASSGKLAFSLKQKSKLVTPPVKLGGDDDEDEVNAGNALVDGSIKRLKTGHTNGSSTQGDVASPFPSDPTEKNVADKLATFVAKNGRHFEDVTRQKNPGDTPFKFLFDESCGLYKYYKYRLIEEENALSHTKDSHSPYSGVSVSNNSACKSKGSLQRSLQEQSNYQIPASALYETPDDSNSSLNQVRKPSTGGIGESSGPTGADPIAMMEYYMKKAAHEEKRRAPKQSKDEMPPPASLQGPSKKGHHMGDYIPDEELLKFMSNCNDVAAQKAAKEAADRAKIQADNVGHKLLSKMGWKEGEGLGSSKSGIADPIKAGDVKINNLGVGAQQPGEVTPEDDIYEQYKKRMMLGYKFRPNPLNNPRKAYY